MAWHVGDRFEVDGKPATVTRVRNRLDDDDPSSPGLIIRNRKTGHAGLAVDWESVERLPDGSPRRLGRKIT